MLHEKNGFQFPTHHEIAYCAYLIWEKEGRPVGREREHWNQAEYQLMACRAHDQCFPSSPRIPGGDRPPQHPMP